MTAPKVFPLKSATPKWLTPEQFAAVMGVSVHAVYRQLRAGTLPVTSWRIGSLWRISRPETERLLDGDSPERRPA